MSFPSYPAPTAFFSRFPERQAYVQHALVTETLAMKGLFMTCLGPDSKLEGYELVKRGVKMDMGSHIVWHVYGLLHRADKNFEEALKCYTQASKIEKVSIVASHLVPSKLTMEVQLQDSMSILGDMATLTIHLRHYEAYVDARLSILRIGPRLRRNWIGLAVSQHLAKQYLEADRTLTSYEQMLREVPEREFDQSEVLLYHAMILEEGGLYERCLEFLSEHNAEIVDRQTYSVQRGAFLFLYPSCTSTLTDSNLVPCLHGCSETTIEAWKSGTCRMGLGIAARRESR